MRKILLASVLLMVIIIMFVICWEYGFASSTSPESVVKAYVNGLLKGDLEAYFTYNFYIRWSAASTRNKVPKERWQEMEQKLKESSKESLQRSIGTIKGQTLPFPWIIFYEYGKVLDEMKGLKKEEIEEKSKEKKWKEIEEKLKGCFLAYDFLYEPNAALKATIEEVKSGPLINLDLDTIFQLGVYKDTPTWEAFIRVEYLQQDTAPWLEGGVKFDQKFDGRKVKEALIKMNVIKIMPKNENERMRVEKLGLGGFIVDGFTEIVEGTLVTGEKTEKRETPKEIPSPGVVKGAEFISKALFVEKEPLGIISDIARGELDRNPGPEIGIVGTRGALLIDNTGKEVALVLFAGKARHVDAIDINGDGECEFMNRGGGWQPVSLFDHQGDKLWSYSPSQPPDDMVAGDLDGDGTVEFVVGLIADGGVHLLDKDGKKQWIRPDANVWHVELVDTDQDGRLEIVHSNAAGQIRVRDRQGKILSQAKPSSYFSEFSLCRWPTLKDRVYALMWAEDKTIKLFDFDGKMVKEFNAPGSVWVMGAWGVPVRLKPDEPEYFAVLVELRGVWNRSILYVYDTVGSLVFQEIIPETCKSIATFPSDKPGGEMILIGGEGKVWEYKAADTTKKPIAPIPPTSIIGGGKIISNYYIHEEKGYKIAVPHQEWVATSARILDVVFRNERGGGWIGTAALAMPESFLFENVNSWWVSIISKKWGWTDVKIVDEKDLTIAGHNAKVVVVEFTSRKRRQVDMTYHIWKPSGAYNLYRVRMTCFKGKFEEFLDVYKAFANSFSFL